MDALKISCLGGTVRIGALLGIFGRAGGSLREEIIGDLLALSFAPGELGRVANSVRADLERMDGSRDPEQDEEDGCEVWRGVLEDIEDAWPVARDDWGLSGSMIEGADEAARVILHDGRYHLERWSDSACGWYVALDDLKQDDVDAILEL